MHAKLLILLIASDQSEWVEGMRRALTEALDPKVQLEISPEKNDRDLTRRRANTTVVAVDFPTSPLEARVRLRSKQQTLERRLTFQPRDAALERGRALGFLISSMVPELRADRVATAEPPRPPPPRRVEPEPPPPPPEPEPQPEPPPEPQPEAPPEPAPPPPAQPEPPPPAPVVVEPAPPPPEPAFDGWRFAVGFAGLGAWGVDRSAPDGGARLTLQLHLWRFTARAGGLFTMGTVPPALATATSAGAFAGASFALITGRLGLSLRVDAAAVWLEVARHEERRSRWQFSAQPRLEATVGITRWLWAELAIGADLGPSSTRVYVDGDEVTQLSPFAGALELGLKAAF